MHFNETITLAEELSSLEHSMWWSNSYTVLPVRSLTFKEKRCKHILFESHLYSRYRQFLVSNGIFGSRSMELQPISTVA